MDVPGTNSVNGAVFNVLNSIIGSGIIGLPYALSNAGMATGLAMLVTVGLVSQFAIYTLVLTGRRVGAMHYSEVARITLGKLGSQALSLSVIVSLAGVVTTYLVILGDIFSSLRLTYLPAQEWLTRSVAIAIVAYVFILPLLFFRHSGPMAKYSVVSVAALPVILLIVAIRAPAYASTTTATDYPVVIGPHVFRALGVLSFSYCSAHAAFQNFLGLRERTMQNWRHATTIATWVAIALCCAFAAIGLASFGSGVQANIFLNFPTTDAYVNIARVLFCLTLVLTFPLSFYPIRDTLTHLLCIHSEQRRVSGRSLESMLTVSALTFICVVAANCTDLGVAYELVGAASATTISFIFPALIFLHGGTDVTLKGAINFGLHASTTTVLPLLGAGDSSTSARWRCLVWQWLGGWFTLLFGMLVFVVGTFSTLQR
ncbi:hypothetical protein IWW39_000773 [Coemansia spiralis]|uniref:Amino acid transporter transmembrane domain-containing protein n=1 Tax=Coemansia spiralis TaxID=417178 RepID=A0A9W8GRH3_9FUNG|nr:hypothetical protein IWW39_000773 [Coemansia spiralis]